MSPVIKITIQPNGATAVEVNGAQGKACRDLTKQFEDALGTVEKFTPKPEFNREPAVTVTH